ncbi:MAG: hypothetical protein IJ309_06835 [Clostridia bacterium]|nr:hypothetical protein [Clostridia bacterium]
MDKNTEPTYEKLRQGLEMLAKENQIVTYSNLGQSLLGRAIPLITLGDRDAKKSVLYVATHHATEVLLTGVLLSFIEEYVSAYNAYKQLFSINLRYLYKMRRIHIIPMLNPDGVEYRQGGVMDDNPLKGRVIAYNGGSEDFSLWSSNARGVDLNHNYDAGFLEYKQLERERGIMPGRGKYSGEEPESEPETSALCAFIRHNLDSLEGVLTLHSQGEEIYYSSGLKIPEKSKHIAKIISRMTGYALSTPEDTACYGGLTDWLIEKYDLPAFTLECGKGQNPLPPSQAFEIYSRLRELLFTFPILF